MKQNAKQPEDLERGTRRIYLIQFTPLHALQFIVRSQTREAILHI
jgi:hypothetical protein